MRYFILGFLCFLLIGCQQTVHTPQVSNKAEIAQIESLMTQQELSWNKGDLEGFMSAYWNSDSMLFIGKRGLNYGWQTTLDNYKKSYTNPTQMGRLVFKNQELNLIDHQHAWAAGSWTLLRVSDTLSGSYMLVWKKENGQWKIIADHSS